jgi:hypothetical protein
MEGVKGHLSGRLTDTLSCYTTCERGCGCGCGFRGEKDVGDRVEERKGELKRTGE